MGELHDFFAGTNASVDGLEDFGFNIGIAKKIQLRMLPVLLEVIFREEQLENIPRLSVRVGALPDELVAALGIRACDIARYSKNFFTLV